MLMLVVRKGSRASGHVFVFATFVCVGFSSFKDRLFKQSILWPVVVHGV